MGFKVQDGDWAAHWSSRTVQTAHANKRSPTEFSCGGAKGVWRRGCARSALNMGKFGERGRRVKKSQQESSLDDRRNLISKIHKSSAEGSSIMGTKGASVKVNIDLLLGRANLLTFSTKRWHPNGGWTEKKRIEKEVSLTEHGGQVGPLTLTERLRNVLCVCAPRSGVKLWRCNECFSFKHY